MRGLYRLYQKKMGAYGRLLLAVYVRWRTGLLISSDWLRPVTRGAWRAVLPDRAGEPDPVHGPGETSWLYKGTHTDRWTIVSWKASSTHAAIWIVLWIFRVEWCDFLFRHDRDLDRNRTVWTNEQYGRDGVCVADSYI